MIYYIYIYIINHICYSENSTKCVPRCNTPIHSRKLSENIAPPAVLKGFLDVIDYFITHSDIVMLICYFG